MYQALYRLTNSEFDSLYSDFLEIKRLLSSIVHKVKNDRT